MYLIEFLSSSSGYYGTGGSPLVTVLLIAVVGLMAVQVFRMFQTKGTSSASGDEDDDESFADEPVTVARVQVGLLAVAKDVKSELDLLAVRADTSTPEGLYLILQGDFTVHQMDLRDMYNIFTVEMYDVVCCGYSHYSINCCHV